MTASDKPGRGGRRLSLRTRIVAVIAVLSGLGLLSAGIVALMVERQRIESRIQRDLTLEIEEFEKLAQGVDPETGQHFAQGGRLIEVFLSRNVPDEHEVQLGFVPPPGEDLTQDVSSPLSGDADFREVVRRYQKPEFGEYTSPAAGRISFAVMPVVRGDQTSHYAVAYYTDLELAELNDAIRTYTITALLAWLALLAGAYLLVSRLLQPMKELRDTAESITDTDLSRRLAVRGDDEIAALSRQFNGMLDRLQAALGSQREMLDDAGHELRTPITIIRGHLELMDAADPADVDTVRDLAIDELDRMALLVEDLILLAKARRPDFLRRSVVEATPLVEDALLKASTLGSRRWVLDDISTGWIVADANRITQALLQLAANAVAVTEPSDTIGFGCDVQADGVLLWVRDTGPGIPLEERQHIFSRHLSGSTGREDGTGLGLAIVLAIAQAHGGSAWVEDGDGGGARFVMHLPSSSRITPEKDEEDGEHFPATKPLRRWSDHDVSPGTGPQTVGLGPAHRPADDLPPLSGHPAEDDESRPRARMR